MNINQALALATDAFSPSDSARLDAEILLAEVLHCSRASLLAHDDQVLTEEQEQEYRRYLAKRKENEPIAYLLGHKEFWSLNLQVTPDTLIPRPETEVLVEQVLEIFPDKKAKLCVADLGTGSGAIALALASERPHWEIIATDQSPEALRVASHNARKLELSNIRFCQGSWYQALPALRFDALISNPPYLSEAEFEHAPKDLFFEPYGALVAESQGLSALKALIQGAKAFLKPGGYLLLEHGSTQAVAVRELFEGEGFSELSTYPDLAGLDRATKGRLP